MLNDFFIIPTHWEKNYKKWIARRKQRNCPIQLSCCTEFLLHLCYFFEFCQQQTYVQFLYRPTVDLMNTIPNTSSFQYMFSVWLQAIYQVLYVVVINVYLSHKTCNPCSQVMHHSSELRIKLKDFHYVILSFYILQTSYINRICVFFAIFSLGWNWICVYCNSSTWFTNNV